MAITVAKFISWYSRLPAPPKPAAPTPGGLKPAYFNWCMDRDIDVATAVLVYIVVEATSMKTVTHSPGMARPGLLSRYHALQPKQPIRVPLARLTLLLADTPLEWQ